MYLVLQNRGNRPYRDTIIIVASVSWQYRELLADPHPNQSFHADKDLPPGFVNKGKYYFEGVTLKINICTGSDLNITSSQTEERGETEHLED